MKKTLIFLAIAVLSVVVVSYATSTKDKQLSVKQPPAVEKIQSIAPQLVNKVGFTDAEPNDIKNTSHVQSTPSVQELVGKVTNPFGIRDDVLDYIIKSIPADNKGAIISAIKRAQIDQQEMFVKDPDKLNKLEDKGSASIMCLNTYIDDDIKTDDFIHGYDALMRNTPERKALQEEIENKLGGHVISSNFGFRYEAQDSYKSLCDRYIKEGV